MSKGQVTIFVIIALDIVAEFDWSPYFGNRKNVEKGKILKYIIGNDCLNAECFHVKTYGSLSKKPDCSNFYCNQVSCYFINNKFESIFRLK